MKYSKLTAALAFLIVAATASAQAPNVPMGGIVNGASFLPNGLPSAGIARGAMFAVFGTQLGPEMLVPAPSLPLGTELGGTSISVTVGGVTRQAFLLYSFAGQLAAILPSDLPAGLGTLTVTFNGLTSAPTPINVVDNAFGIFSRNQGGYGPAILQNYVSATDQPVNAIIDAAHPGQVVILWGTGLGPITGGPLVDSDMPPVGNLPVTVEVWVGGRLASVQYAGRSFSFPAIDQINFTIPAGVTGCYVPVVVVVNGVTSNQVTIAITEDGPYCSDFQTFQPGELETVVQNGQGGFGFIEMARFRGVVTTQQGATSIAFDQVLGEFRRFTKDQIVATTPSREAVAPIGACITNLVRDSVGRPDAGIGASLSAGSELMLSGPLGVKAIPQDNSGYEADVGGGLGDNVPPPYFVAGNYVLRGGSGAADIGPFEASLSLPDNLQWLNQSAFNVVRRDQDLTVQWTGGDAATEFVVVSVQSINLNDDVAGTIFCTAAADAGILTVPRRLLGALPSSTPWNGNGDPTGLISVGAEPLSSAGQINATGLVSARLFYANRIVRTIGVE